ncbi:hypothetical protein [Halobacillus naozhouensis]|uniref:Loader and inhibitor of phage G40P n=1 Tax=Halobacillus naozhouensis TaxID=554880 RepID=A0ABY8IVK7_9BACI|nr:hypothetical protein [Halobacillus naozhouensis]WFT74219.1 hypothetical protein P9989_17920 [Halobacillus naozhouensis]
MDHREALEVLETISELYSNKFEITKRVADILIPELMEMDFPGVMKKLSAFAARNVFPPTLSEIAVYPPEKNTTLEKIQQWEQEAASVSAETKQRFLKQLQQLVEGMSRDS